MFPVSGPNYDCDNDSDPVSRIKGMPTAIRNAHNAGEIVLAIAKANDKTHKQLFMEGKTKSQNTTIEKKKKNLPKLSRAWTEF